MKLKKLLALALSGVLALSLAAPAMAAEDEAPSAPWYAEAQAYVTDKGYMTTVDGTNFAPEGTVTRATVFQTFWNMLDKPEAKACTFTDIPENAWYASSAAWAENVGLAQGDWGRFHGDRAVTRAEAAAIFARYARLDGWDVDVEGSEAAQAPDYADIPAWAQTDMVTCYELGVMSGDQNGALLPDKTLTRAELAAMLMALDSLVPSYVEEYVEIEVPETDGIPAHTIPGILTYPGAEGKYPAVVMLHGTGSNKNEAGGGYDLAAPEMAMAGIVTLRFDFMGIGDSTASYTDYCFTSANIDAKAAADYLAEQDYVDADKLAVQGWSQGGTNALLAAAAYPETFKAVITWAGSVTQRTGEEFEKQYEIAKKDGYYEETFDWRDPLHVGLRWYEENLSFNKLDQTAKIEAPIFAIQGLKDTSVAPENAEQIVEVAKNEATRAFFIEDCDHTFNVFTEAETGYPTIYKAIYAGIGFIQETFNGAVTGTVTDVSKYGNITTDINADVFAGAGYVTGDILKITIGDQTFEAPYGTGYSNVDTGSAIVLPDSDTGCVAAAVNMGNFSKTYNAPEGTAVSFSMGEKEGYLEEYEIRNIDSLRTNEREDYESDEVFANFRAVTVGDIAKGKLYRGSSPVNPELGRNEYVDELVKKAKVKTIIDLADSEEEYEGYEGVKDTYAYTTNTVKLDMGVDFAAEDFTAKLKTGLEYMLANEGPYYIHCNEGKDRCGFVTMLLEMLMNGEVDEIVEDYMLSYENYYGVEKDSDRWNRIAQSNVISNMLKITGAEDEKTLRKTDLVDAARTYLTGTVGLGEEQVDELVTALSK